MEPLISLTIRNRRVWFAPGDELDCEFQIDRIGPNSIQAVEASVLWSTSGKGDVDMGVHFFERRTAEDLPDGDLRELHRFRTICPPGPLSYEGELIRIRWCVRIRVFPLKGKETSFDLPFRLGQVPAPNTLTSGAVTSERKSSTASLPLDANSQGARSSAAEETASVEMTIRRPNEEPPESQPPHA